MRPTLLLALIASAPCFASRSVTVPPLTARIDHWPASWTGAGGNCIRPINLIRLENLSDTPQDVTVSIPYEDVRNDSNAAGIEYRASVPRPSANRSATATIAAGGSVELGFTAACGLLTAANTIDCVTYVQTQIAPVCDATRLFNQPGGRYYYTSKIKIAVDQDRGAIMATVFTSLQVSNWGTDTQWSTVQTVVNGGRPF